MNILVTGGAGYIGSHACVALLEAGHSVIIVDNLSNSTRDNVDNIMNIAHKGVVFFRIDMTDTRALHDIFIHYKIDGVIHLAGNQAVGESAGRPPDYYTNILSTLVLVKACHKYGVHHFVFSSSATVYGDNNVPFAESMKLSPTTNPYAETKVMSERIIKGIAKVNPNFEITILRYDHPVGAHESGLIGEASKRKSDSLITNISKVAKGQMDKLKVFGHDYPTADGTGVRDYIHVMDVAEGHVTALDKLAKGIHVYNLGSGRGTSVLEFVKAFEAANDIEIPYEIVDRRPGDRASYRVDVSKAKRELGWSAKRDTITMCRDAWRFETQEQPSDEHLLIAMYGEAAAAGEIF